jgi:hypothetical protein
MSLSGALSAHIAPGCLIAKNGLQTVGFSEVKSINLDPRGAGCPKCGDLFGIHGRTRTP